MEISSNKWKYVEICRNEILQFISTYFNLYLSISIHYKN